MVEMVRVTINDQYDIVLPRHRADRPEWYTEEGWEKKRLAHMHENISHRTAIGAQQKIYYVGAEEGDMAALCQMWGANMLLFEPNQKVLPNLKAIWDANDLSYPELFVGFAGNETTKKPDWMKRCKAFENIKGEVIHDHGFKELRDPGDIPIIKIDDCVSSGSISPSMICLDVEGSEWEVLRGAEQTLKTFRPSIYLSLHPEFLHEQYGEWGAELRRWIIDLGYEETLIDYPLHEVHLYYEAIK